MPATTSMSPERAQAAMAELIKHGLAREIVVNGVKGIQLTGAGIAHAKRLLEERLMDDFELQAHISAARRKILCGAKTFDEIDTLHPMWDVIFDAEAHLKGKETICSREQCENDLKKFVPNPEPLLPEQVEYVKNLRKG